MNRLAMVLAVGGAIALVVGGLRLARGDPTAAEGLTARTASYSVRLLVDRPRPGVHAAVVEVAFADGEPVEAAAVTVAPVMVEMGHATPEVRAVAEGSGRYRAPGVLFSMAGRWELDVQVRVDGQTETARFAVDVG